VARAGRRDDAGSRRWHGAAAGDSASLIASDFH